MPAVPRPGRPCALCRRHHEGDEAHRPRRRHLAVSLGSRPEQPVRHPGRDAAAVQAPDRCLHRQAGAGGDCRATDPRHDAPRQGPRRQRLWLRLPAGTAQPGNLPRPVARRRCSGAGHPAAGGQAARAGLLLPSRPPLDAQRRPGHRPYSRRHGAAAAVLRRAEQEDLPHRTQRHGAQGRHHEPRAEAHLRQQLRLPVRARLPDGAGGRRYECAVRGRSGAGSGAGRHQQLGQPRRRNQELQLRRLPQGIPQRRHPQSGAARRRPGGCAAQLPAIGRLFAGCAAEDDHLGAAGQLPPGRPADVPPVAAGDPGRLRQG